jgi:hypothetical protein
MDLSTGGSEPAPFRDHADSPGASAVDAPADDVWFEVHGRDGTLVGTSNRVVHRRADQTGNATIREWAYADLRSVQVVDGGHGRDPGSIVIEPVRGPLVPVPLAEGEREEAFQAATVFELLIARAQRSAPILRSIRR